MPPRPKPYTFTVSLDAVRHNLTGYLDMCRYDQCTVTEATSDLLVLRRGNGPPTAGRWASFGIHVLSSVQGDFADRQLMDEGRAKLPSVFGRPREDPS